MKYKINLSEYEGNLLLNANIKVENKEYSVHEIKRERAHIGSYIISKSSKNGKRDYFEMEKINEGFR